MTYLEKRTLNFLNHIGKLKDYYVYNGNNLFWRNNNGNICGGKNNK